MKKYTGILWLLVAVFAAAPIVKAQYNQAVVDHYTTISGFGREYERKNYFSTLDSATKASVARYHIDEKIENWTWMNGEQTDALYALKAVITPDLVSAAEGRYAGLAAFSWTDYNNAMAEVESLFDTDDLNELKMIGEMPSNFVFADAYEPVFYDPDTREYTLDLGETCGRQRLCFVVCNCNLDSLCDTCWGGNCRPWDGWGGCGCFYFFTCNGVSGRRN